MQKIDRFLKLMNDYFAANATKTVTAQSFLDKAGVSFDFTEPADGPAYAVSDIGRRLAIKIINFQSFTSAEESTALRDRLFR